MKKGKNLRLTKLINEFQGVLEQINKQEGQLNKTRIRMHDAGHEIIKLLDKNRDEELVGRFLTLSLPLIEPALANPAALGIGIGIRGWADCVRDCRKIQNRVLRIACYAICAAVYGIPH